MSIVQLKKVSILGHLEQKHEVLVALQKFGRLHLIPLDAANPTVEASTQSEKKLQDLAEDLKKALQYLEASPVRRKQALFNEEINIESLVEQVLKNQIRKREVSDQYDALIEREKNLKPWGNFDFPPLDELGEYRLWFYILPHKYRDELDKLDYPWEIIHRDHHKSWLVLLSEDEPAQDVLPVPRFHTGEYSLNRVREKRIETELLLEDIEIERQKYTRYIHVLKRLRARAEDISQLSEAMYGSADLDTLFIVQAWVPKNTLISLQELAIEMNLALYEEEVSEEETPPTLLSNPPGFGGGELLVNFYQAPAYRSWDPSILLFASFSLFFAMILSDAAYSLILGAALIVAWRTLGKTATGLRLRPLFFVIVMVSTIWGMLVGSYFGNEAPTHSLLGKMQIFDINDFDSMMQLSIACGLIHIMLANIHQIILNLRQLKALLNLGWIVVLASGAAFAWSVTSGDGNIKQSALIYWAGGFGLLLVFIGGGQRRLQKPTDYIWRFLEGLKAMTNITNLFGDVLSYLRLFALGLASASLALTFNNLASNAMHSESGLGLLFGILILIIGHSLNLFLAIVSGVVHGLRLNFIEFYKWALEGEGYPFKAFEKREYSK